jgi:hypothetical protein
MKRTDKRVFAYHLAKAIDNQDLVTVSGGGSASGTAKQTVRISAAAGAVPTPDVIYDYTPD